MDILKIVTSCIIKLAVIMLGFFIISRCFMSGIKNFEAQIAFEDINFGITCEYYDYSQE